MITSCALSEAFDLSAMTNDELLVLRNQIDAELDARKNGDDDDIIRQDSECKVWIPKYYWFYQWQTRGYTLAVNIDWTNLSGNPRSFGWDQYCVAYADGVKVGSTESETKTEVLPGYSLQVYYDFEIPGYAKTVELHFVNYLTHETYYTMTINVE